MSALGSRVSNLAEKVGDIADKVSAFAESASEGGILDAIFDSLDFNEELYFYLVDEFTMQPVVPEHENSVYPITIKTPRKFVGDVLPLMKVGLKAMSVGKFWIYFLFAH